MRRGRTLEQFAKRIESHIRKNGSDETMERLICRLMTGEDVKVAAILAAKWVEWRYGKSPQPVTGEGGTGPVPHTITVVTVGE